MFTIYFSHTINQLLNTECPIQSEKGEMKILHLLRVASKLGCPALNSGDRYQSNIGWPLKIFFLCIVHET